MANRARRVIQCDLSGEEIRLFENALEASRSLGGKDATSIHRSIQYGRPAFGFRWKYEGEELKPMPSGTPGKRRKVISINVDAGIETAYLSLSQASRELGIRVSAIESALQTGCVANGYRFRYQGKPLVEQAKRRSYRRSIIGIDKDGTIKRWESAYEAATSLGVIASAIYGCLNSKNSNARCKGYLLRYDDKNR